MHISNAYLFWRDSSLGRSLIRRLVNDNTVIVFLAMRPNIGLSKIRTRSAS